MKSFTFEYSRRGETPLLVEMVEVASDAALWCHVEAMALRVGESPGAFIRVRNDKGQAVVRTGVATALASIEKCPCACCEVKKAVCRGETPGGAIEPSPCRALGACACGSVSPKCE